MKFSRYKILSFAAIALIAVMGVLLRPQTAMAHPLGNFTINTLSIVEVAADGVSVRFILDMAEIPAFQELANIDLDGDENVSDEENVSYLSLKVDEIVQDVTLAINHMPVQLEAIAQSMEFPPGQGDLPTIRIVVDSQGSLPELGEVETLNLSFHNESYADRLGMKEMIVKAGDGVSLLNTTAKTEDVTDELRVYPEEFLQNPPFLREVSATFSFAEGVSVSNTQSPTQPATQSSNALNSMESVAKADNVLTSLITGDRLTLPVIALSLVIAIGLGALHAASPGHGKTIMAAYLVGTRGTAIHAVFLGITVTVSHTLGVVALGLVVVFASSLIAPELLFPWLSLISGGIIIVIGLWLLASRLLENRNSHTHHHHDDESQHSHSHDEPDRAHEQTEGFFQRVNRIGTKILHGHTHDTPHNHDHDHEHEHPHPHPHDEVQPQESRLRITWQSLTALGIVGGLVPSASALIILLASISLQRIGFGMVLILAFSAGMAAVLTGIGLLLVYARRLVERFQSRSKPLGFVNRLLPLTTAIVVLISGLVVAVRALFQVGLV